MYWLTLLAEGEQQQPQGGLAALLSSPMAPMVLIIAVMMIFMSRSSARQRREAQALLAGMKKNDKVVTQAGIIGVVVSINEEEVTLRVDETTNSRIRVLRSSIVKVTSEEQAAQAAENKTS